MAWLELWHLRERSDEDAAALSRLKATVDLLATVTGEGSSEGAAMALVTELVNAVGCDRVSFGFWNDRRVSVAAVSHTAHFTRRMNLHRAVARAMEESLVQREAVRFPLPEDAPVLVNRDHAELASLQGVTNVMTIPLHAAGRYKGALTFERSAERPFTADEVQFGQSVAALACPALEAKRLEERPLAVKAWHALQEQVRRMIGPGRTRRKLLAVLAVVLVAVLVFAKGDYRLAADLALEGAVIRTLVAPFDGFIREAPARPGDVVSENGVLCRLDDRDLRLERVRLAGQRTQLQRQLQEALANRDRVNVNVVGAQLDQTEAQIALVESRLGRAEIRSPFIGIVISGDLSQRLGGAVRLGEVLFEVAPLDTFRVALEVDERRIADVHPGQTGHLVLSALPDETLAFTIERLTPIAEAREGRTFFRVEARLADAGPRLRPGMEGVGKIDVDRRLLVSIYTRDLVEWVKLKAWRYLP